MEKLNKSITIDYLPVIIYFDDLEEITSILSENGISYKIETDNYKYDDIKELIKLEKKESTNSLTIRTDTLNMTVQFRKMSANISIINDGVQITGLLYKIDKIIKPTERIFSFCYNTLFYFIINFSVLPIAIIAGLKLIPVSIFIAYLIAISIIYTSRYVYIKSFKYSSIKFVYKKHAPGFLKRNKDKLILIVISALIGALIGALILHITANLFK